MKRRFNKLLAVILSAAMCLPMLPADTVSAATDPNIRFTDEEQIFINNYGEDRSSIINDNWKFYFGELSGASDTNFNDADWGYVDLPHDFSITQEFTANGEAESGFLLGGTGWYRKHITLPESLKGQRIVLNFDGVYKDSTVYVNGTKIGEHHYGYSPFAFDITDSVVCDGTTDNVIAVEAINEIPSSRWYSGSGIYRDVSLIFTSPVHVAHNGTYVTTPNLKTSEGSDGTVNIAVDVQNDSTASASVTVRNTLCKKNSETALASSNTSVTVEANATKTTESALKITSPDLWSIDNPNLYYVRTEILQGTTVLDTYDTEFGFKWYEFIDNTGFQLNGKNTKIKGVCMHHDQGALGSAAYYDAIYRQLTIMKDMGVNTIRITHNPGAEIFIDICNELGLLVIEEMFDGWGRPKNGNSNDFSVYFDRNLTDDNQIIDGSSDMTWSEFVMKSTIKRDRNDASIILWSLGNEIQEGSDGNYDWTGKVADLIRWAEEVDTTHPLTSGSNNSGTGETGVPGVNNALQKNGGVPGFNYQARYSNISTIDGIKNAYKVILWSETASAVNSRGIYTNNSTGAGAIGGHLTSYDESCVDWGNPAHETMWWTLNRDWIAGECVWTGFDYIGEPTPWNGTGTGIHNSAPNKSIAAPNSSYFGIVETSGFPKDNYYLYRSQWNQDPGANTLNLVTAWDPDNMKTSNGKTPVWVYSNAATVKLYRTVNGQKTLIGTATRKNLDETTTEAGHVHYEYETASNDETICTTSSGTNYNSIYSVFNVAFEDGTVSAEAFDEDGNDITDTCEGKTSVTTPGTPAKLAVSQDKKEILADGSSLVYIAVDVTDANGNLDTTADNDITFTLTGEGEILGVDNGDQATVDKFQQPSVLTNKTSAHIKAFSGKALAIVRSTRKGGRFKVDVSAEGLTGGSAQVTTTWVEGNTPSTITSYDMAKHCYVPAGTTSIPLPEKVSVIRADETTNEASVSWESYDKANLQKAGTFTVKGTIDNDGTAINVSMLIHVYKDIVTAKNISLYTGQNIIPQLPSALMTYAADATAFEEFPVTWNTTSLTPDDFSEINSIIKVEGVVDAQKLLGKSFPVTASIRVAEGTAAGTENIAPAAATISQNCSPVADNLNTVNDGNRNCTAADQSSRWTDWNDDRADKVENPPAITLTWDTVHVVDEIRLFYANNLGGVEKPKTVKIALSFDGTTFEEIGYANPEIIPEVENVSTEGASFKLNEASAPIAVRIILERNGAAVGLTEIEVISTQFEYQSFDSANLTSVTNGSQTITFNEQDKIYHMEADSIDAANLQFGNPNNAAVTTIPESDTVARIITVSEDGKTTNTYVLITDAAEMPTEESKQALGEKIEASSAIDSSLQNLDSYKTLLQIIEETKDRLDTMTESDLTDNFTVLEDAYKNIYKEAIREKIAAYKALNSSLYTPESYKALQTLISQTESQMNTMSESQLQTRLADLNNFKLVAADKNDPKPTLTTSDKVTVANVEYQVLDPAKKTVAAVRLTNKNASKITIQNTVTIKTISCNVVQINTNVFKGAKKLKTVKLGKYVTNIGKGAFANCTKLKTVTFQETNVTIAKGTFKKAKSGITVKGTKKLKGKKKTAFKKKLTKAGMKNPKLK